MLAFAGVWGFTWGIKGSQLETVDELDYDGKVIAYSVMYLIALLGSAAYSWAYIRHPKKQWAVRSYTSVLYFWAVVFAAIAITAPSQTQKAAEAIDYQCQNETNPLWLADAVYTAANGILCKACVCYANRTEW